MRSDTGSAGNQGQRGVQWLQGCKWAAITVVVVASPMLGKVSQVTASGFAQTAHAQPQAHSAVSDRTAPSLLSCSCCHADGGVPMPPQQGSRPDWGTELRRHADMQVSMERTIGTVCGGLLGLGISLLGHGFGQDSDMVFTGDTLPALLYGVRTTQQPGNFSCVLP